MHKALLPGIGKGGFVHVSPARQAVPLHLPARTPLFSVCPRRNFLIVTKSRKTFPVWGIL